MTGSRSDGSRVEAVILAAGKGTRMKSDLAKVLHPLAGRPLLAHVLACVGRAGIDRTVVVVGHQADKVQAACPAHHVIWVRQEPQLGTGHAVQVAAPVLQPSGFTVVLNGDVPLLRPETIGRLVDRTQQSGVVAAVLTCVAEDAQAYGRIVKDPSGHLLRIVEARDASPAELAIGEFNTGVYCFRTRALVAALGQLTNDNDQQEYYLTDTVAYLVGAGNRVAIVAIDDPGEVIGINTPAELAEAEGIYLARQA